MTDMCHLSDDIDKNVSLSEKTLVEMIDTCVVI